MLKILFFIRFRGQLRRVKPELVESLEAEAAGAFAAAGGAVENGRKFLKASFNEESIGFWLDMAVLLEKLCLALKKDGGELYGFAVALGRENQESSMERLCRFLSQRGRNDSGIWCSPEAREALEPYAAFGPLLQEQCANAGATAGEGVPPPSPGGGGYGELLELKPFGKSQREYPYRDKIGLMLAAGEGNAALYGPEFSGKRDGVYRSCAGFLGNIPPLIVRFGAGGRGLACFADALTPCARTFIAGGGSGLAELSGGILEELDASGAALFRERLREEQAPHILDEGRRFIRSLLTAYAAALKNADPEEPPPPEPTFPAADEALPAKKAKGALILEEPSLADPAAAKVFIEAYASLDDKEKESFLVLAADNAPGGLSGEWGSVFPRMLQLFPGESSDEKGSGRPRFHKIPQDLWELAYNFHLLGRYFPGSLFPRLCEEEGFGRDMYFRAFAMLSALGAVEGDDPRPRIPDFRARAEKALGERKEPIRAAARGRVFAWVASGKLSPCFDLVKALAELGGQADDALVLRSVKADARNGTWKAIDEALEKGRFASLAGAGNADALSYIYKTLKALVWGNRGEIERAFETPPPSPVQEDGSACYGACRAQAQANLAAYYIGVGSFDDASEALRKAMLLNRDLGENAIPAFRLFALANFCRQRVNDALEYIAFAQDQAERAGQGEELAISCYAAASINLIYGNLSKAERLAKKAEKTALSLSRRGWAERAKFLQGRICFEIGRYGEALEIFESQEAAMEAGAGSREIPRNGEMASALRAWAGRARLFLGRPSPREDGLDGGAAATSDATSAAGFDGKLFEIEAAHFAGDFEKVEALAGRFLEAFGEDSPPAFEAPADGSASGAISGANSGATNAAICREDFLFTEQPDWRSAFAQCENMFQPGKFPGKRLAWVYRTMARTALARDPAAKAEQLDGMQRFMRDEPFPDTDPNDAFFFWAWYSMLRTVRNSGVSRVDINTVVSMACKRIQRRADRIDDEGVKRAFLTLPRWNSALSLAAREYKII